MAKYKLIEHLGETVAIQKKEDIDPSTTVSFPLDKENTDYQEYLEWVAEGNTAEAAD